MYIGYTLAVYAVARYLTGFDWSSQAKRISVFSLLAMALTYMLLLNLTVMPATIVGITLTIVLSLYSLRELVQRVGIHHGIIRLVFKVPGLRLVCGL